ADLGTALEDATLDTQGSDRVVLPAGTLSDANGFNYDGHVPVEIDGQGVGSTVLTAPADVTSGSVMTFDPAAPSVTLQGFTVEVQTTAGSDNSGVYAEVPVAISN